jgi:hypothetical protein
MLNASAALPRLPLTPIDHSVILSGHIPFPLPMTDEDSMFTLEWLKEVAMILYYVSLSITGPVALFGYLQAKKKEQQDREYRTYDELDNKFLAYQELALRHDLDLIEVPDASVALAGDRLRLKQELVTASCGFALFQRAFLMFHEQTNTFKARQWQGWDRLLTSFVRRAGVRHAWMICKLHFDTKFQALVDDRILALLEENHFDPAVIYAFRKTGLLLEEANEHRATETELANWNTALAEYRAAA